MTEKTAEQIAAEQAEAQRKADEKAAEKARKEAEKAEAKAKREAEAAEKNGIRRPKPDTLCGKAWGIFDSVSQKNGAPASIGESMELAKADGLNEANVRAEYARWRKFHGITGRIEPPLAPSRANLLQ
jgi:membrane protein involved in colicin uptake